VGTGTIAAGNSTPTVCLNVSSTEPMMMPSTSTEDKGKPEKEKGSKGVQTKTNGNGSSVKEKNKPAVAVKKRPWDNTVQTVDANTIYICKPKSNILCDLLI